MIFGHFIDFGHFPIEIPIEAEKFYGQQKEGTYIKNKNCFENRRPNGTIWNHVEIKIPNFVKIRIIFVEGRSIRCFSGMLFLCGHCLFQWLIPAVANPITTTPSVAKTSVYKNVWKVQSSFIGCRVFSWAPLTKSSVVDWPLRVLFAYRMFLIDVTPDPHPKTPKSSGKFFTEQWSRFSWS